jgi:hypothetical protein
MLSEDWESYEKNQQGVGVSGKLFLSNSKLRICEVNTLLGASYLEVLLYSTKFKDIFLNS